MLLGQVARFDVVGVERVWDAVVWDSGSGTGRPGQAGEGQGLLEAGCQMGRAGALSS